MKHFTSLIEHSREAVRYWWLFAVVGVLLVVGGIMTFVYPAQSYLALSVLFGWLMLIAGILEIVVATANRHFITGRGWMVAGGVIEVVLGIILIFNVALSAATMPIFLGFWLLMRSFATIGFGGDMRALGGKGAWWTVIGGILLMLCSLWILMQPVVVGSAAVLVWVGISLLLSGVSTCAFAMQLRTAHRCFDAPDTAPARSCGI